MCSVNLWKLCSRIINPFGNGFREHDDGPLETLLLIKNGRKDTRYQNIKDCCRKISGHKVGSEQLDKVCFKKCYFVIKVLFFGTFFDTTKAPVVPLCALNVHCHLLNKSYMHTADH